MRTSDIRELVVIGGGPGGYPAAFYAADLGMDVTLIDLEANPGGVCLHRGCIPSKALLHAASVLSEAAAASEFGISFGEPQLDVDKLRRWKSDVVGKLTGGLGQLSKARKINFIQGRATFIDSTTLRINRTDGGEEVLSFKTAIVATGSTPARIPIAPDSPRVLDSTGALELPDIPERLLVIGGGYIGLELGQAYAAFGSKVSVVEMLPSLLAGADPDLVRPLHARLKRQFETIMLKTKVLAIEDSGAEVAVTVEGPDGKREQFSYDRVLISVGRKPNTRDFGLENTKVEIGEDGFVVTDNQRRTGDPAIYAIGDIAGQPMLAHKATYEGKVAVEAIAGKKTIFAPKAIPAVVFTDPEIAWAGVSENEAKTQGLDVKVSKFPWGASGRATTLGRSDGVTKIIADPVAGRVLGVGITGPGAGELIAEGVLAIEMGAVAEDLALTIHAHPTLSETVMEAGEDIMGHATHFVSKK
ncbi:MAG: dihydrolipoyl dehydrogenase [Verrucomicrobia bacterium]|jgi:dihydrolipoamide dehydrogenase|nr:dihydrolipoyl dehydrogenase [Verrucomicrobiota bacterium]